MTDAIVTTGNTGFIAPVVDVTTALRRYQAVKEFISGVLREGVDFGVIPGSTKPTLLKAGAEKMTSFFGFQVRTILVASVEDWTGEEHQGEPFFYYRYRIQLWRGDVLVAEGEGSANSWEKKYRYRQAERICPKCGKATIIKGKEEYGGGWVCFAKKGGCGAKFGDEAPEIINQQLGQVKNPDPADTVNTLQKMAQKRGLVAPVLIATNTSDYFTQDVEDFFQGDFTEATYREAKGYNPTQPESDVALSNAAPVAQSRNASSPAMTLETAMRVMTSDDTPRSYGSLTDKELDGRRIQFVKQLKENNLTPEEKELKQWKLSAVAAILTERAKSKKN